MNEIKTIKIHCLSTAVTPITHMMGTSGNEALINREKVMCVGEIHEVPVISGNALRHKAVRYPGAMHITKTCGLVGKLTIDQANFLFNGGALTDSSISENLAKIAAMQELLPLYRLLGGSLRNQVIGGSLLVGRGILVCEENREVLNRMLPEGLLPTTDLRSCADFVSQWQYTRSDVKKHPELLEIADEEQDGSPMIYSGENVIPGAVFYHSFILQNVSRLELGALLYSLHAWQEEYGGMIGGQARIGHGKLKTEIFPDGDTFFGDGLDPAGYIQEYLEHTYSNRERIARWLQETFPKGGKKPRSKKEVHHVPPVKPPTADWDEVEEENA